MDWSETYGQDSIFKALDLNNLVLFGISEKNKASS